MNLSNEIKAVFVAKLSLAHAIMVNMRCPDDTEFMRETKATVISNFNDAMTKLCLDKDIEVITKDALKPCIMRIREIKFNMLSRSAGLTLSVQGCNIKADGNTGVINKSQVISYEMLQDLLNEGV